MAGAGALQGGLQRSLPGMRKNQNLGSCDCDTTVRDPRMAKILDIFNNGRKIAKAVS